VPEIDTIDVDVGPASGNTKVILSGHGFHNYSKYELVFRDTLGQEMVAEDMIVLDSNHLEIITPAWGGSFPVDAGGVRFYVYYSLYPETWYEVNGTKLVDTYVDRPVFIFFATWATFSQDNMHGAKGGDPITFVASGLQTRTDQFPLLYKCVFTAYPSFSTCNASKALQHQYTCADPKYQLNSTSVDATSSTELTCYTPTWGDHFRANNVSVRLIESYSVDVIVTTEETHKITSSSGSIVNVTSTKHTNATVYPQVRSGPATCMKKCKILTY